MSLLLTPSQQEQVVAAIRSAELVTSGEVRVHIETNCLESDVIERAKQVFADLGMHRTDLKNGVLFYLATDDRKFAVLGDKGINERVPDNFWNNVRDTMRAHFKKNEFAEGLSQGIQLAGEQLKTFFPRQANDINELSDDISFG
ncbi:TPM domain-containing protein [Runella limosa]|uniref:TPM domain-containing protein n=1 Tax=Runella limosa TaxID=370978 RepID=UPI0003FD25E8|nr:TPM domain-containing protein [Runella limosa]MCA0231374.1 TPM domain-containing protein [Bacteroidota bacterium]